MKYLSEMATAHECWHSNLNLDSLSPCQTTMAFSAIYSNILILLLTLGLYVVVIKKEN